MTNEQRAAVLQEARAWSGTPYVGHAHVKGVGGDCGQILYGIYHACGLLPDTALPKDYSLQVGKHMASTEYVDFILRYFREIPEAEVQPGDLVVYSLGHAFTHGGIIESWPDFVWQAEDRHGFSGAHGIKDHRLRQRPRRFFTLKDGVL